MKPTITVQADTAKNPISLIGYEAGVCWSADVTNEENNYKRGIDCLASNHGRTLEFPQVYLTIDGYSARVIRELYTHIGGGPTRLQASTRYINYEKGFEYITPPTIQANAEALDEYKAMMDNIQQSLQKLEALGVPREDSALGLPLGMTTKIVLRTNLRNLIDMSHQRLCTRAYWEYRRLMNDMIKALSEYSPEWATITKQYFMPKCEVYGFCTEKNGCGRKPKKKTENSCQISDNTAEYTKIAENINTTGELVDALSGVDRDTHISLMGVDGFAMAKHNGEDVHVLMDEPAQIADLSEEEKERCYFTKQLTNGDMIKAMFPNIDACVRSISNDNDVIDVVDVYNLGIYCQTFDMDWWNAQYKHKAESEDK